MSRIILKNGKIFDSINGKILENKTIVLNNNQISWIGEESQYEKEEKDTVIDCTSKVILPGLIDCHVHLGFKATPLMDRAFMRTSSHMYHYIALHHAQNHLKAGFTTVRDCGGDRWGASLRRALQNNMFPGPRVLVAQWSVGQWGNQEFVGPDAMLEHTKKYEVISGKDGVIHAVRDRKRMGSDFIKTLTTGGVLHGQESKVEVSLWTEDELVAMVTEAHRLGMHVASHAHGDQGIYEAAKSGIDTIEHGTFISEETADMMIKKGTYLIPTHRAGYGLIQPETIKQLPPEVVVKTKAVWKGMRENHKMAFEKGVKIALGTDSGTPTNPHGSTAKEIALMVENLGMSPTQVLQAATIEASKAIQLDDVIGSITIGKKADIVIVNKNPLENITVLEELNNIDYVIKDGKIIVKYGVINI